MACKAEIEARILSAIRNPALAEDIAAEAIQRVIAYADRHRNENEIGNVKSFLITTARNLLHDAQTKKLMVDKLDTVSLDDEQATDLTNTLVDEKSTQAIISRMETDEVISSALINATEQERQIFQMLFLDEMTVQEIAMRLGVNEAAIRNRVRRLRSRLRAILKRNVW